MRDIEIKRVRELAEQENYPAAIELGDELAKKRPGDAEVHRVNAYVHRLLGDCTSAIEHMSRAIALVHEPDYFFNRAMWQIDIGNFTAAVSDATNAIEIETKAGTRYYFEGALFVRAVAKMQLNDFEGVRRDLVKVQDNASLWLLGRLYSKAELLEWANESMSAQ